MLKIRPVLISLYLVKTVRNISLYLLMVSFMIPATGFYYTKHSCLKSGKVQLVMDGNYSCCKAEIIQTESSCCNMEKSTIVNSSLNYWFDNSVPECCINEGKYLKSEDDYTFPGRIEMPDIDFVLTVALFFQDVSPFVRESIEEKAHSPPPGISTIDILHKYSVLII